MPAAAEAELRRRLHAFVLKYCPPWLRDRVDDITQTAWLRLDRARDRSDGNREPGTTLLARVAYCATIDEGRRHGRRREVALDAAPEIGGSAAADGLQAARAAEIRAAIEDCLETLVENRSLAVSLRLLGHSVREVAERLGWTPHKAENLVYRGLRDLRRCLGSKGITP